MTPPRTPPVKLPHRFGWRTVLACLLAGAAAGGGAGEARAQQPAGDPALDLFVPVILSASGRSGSFFTSEMTLTNRGSTEATLRYTYTAAAGGGSGEASERLAAGRQRVVADAIEHLGALGVPLPGGGNRIGTLRVAVSGSSEVGVTVRTTTRVDGGRAGLAYAGIAAAGGFTEEVWLCGLRQNRGDRSNVALQNLGKEGSITLRTTVYSGNPTDRTGAMLEEVTLGPGGFHQFNGVLGQAGKADPESGGYVKVERVSGEAPFYAYGVINDQANSDGSFVFPVTAASLAGVRRQTLPVIIEHANFSSELIVTNFSSSAKALAFRFVSEAIGEGEARFELSLGAGEQRIIPEVVAELRRQGVEGIGPAGRTLAGAVFAEAVSGDMSGVVIGARTGSPGGGGQYSVFYNAAPEGTGFSEEAWIEALRQDGENRSNLALVNTGEVDGGESVFELEIYDGASGDEVNRVTGIRVPARGWHQINGILGNHAPGTTQGYVRVRKTAGNNPFLAYGVINDGGAPGQRSGDGAYLPAVAGRMDGGSGEMTDREVLEKFYHATGGPEWADRTHWLSQKPLEEWFGVGTDEEGRVTSLEFSYNRLTGSIPAFLRQLDHLERLDLLGNQLSGAIPVELSALANLQWLFLGINQLSGAIPAELSALANLRGLGLGGNQLSGAIPVELSALTNLQSLNLVNNQLSGSIPAELSALTNLQSLSLANNQLSGAIPAELSALTNLRDLILGSNHLVGTIPQSLVQLSRLLNLSIDGTRVCVPADAAFQAWLATIPGFISSGIACDGSLRVSFSASTYEVTEGGSVEVRVDLNDHAPGPARSATVALTVGTEGGATGADYGGVPERVAITAPAATATFRLTAAADSHFDHAERIVLGFQRPLPSGVTAGSPETATVTIVDPGTGEATDRELLEGLYSGNGGPEWSDRTHWMSEKPLGEWFGVGTDGNGRVTSLDLGGNGLTGAIPAFLGQLDHLERLSLGNNQLSEAIPAELANLTRLHTLYLNINQLSGAIPVELSALSNLQWLRLGSNQLSGGIPSELSNLTRLQGLYLNSNQLSGAIPAELAALSRLQALFLENNQLSGGIPAELAALSNLQWLNLSGNQLDGSIPAGLANLTKLQELHLGDNQLSGAIPVELAALSNLQSLGLSNNRLSGGIPSELSNLTMLQGLFLVNNQLSGAIPVELSALSNLQSLGLSNNRLSGEIPSELSNLTMLQGLFLRLNQLSGSIPVELSALSKLQTLGLEGNQLSGSVPAELSALTDLQQLFLGFNPDLAGTIPAELQQLPLSALNLRATSICVPGDAAFQDWLATIDFFGSSGLTCGSSPDEMPSIDVAVFYTPAARREAGGKAEIEARIDLMIAETNRAYRESGVNQRISLTARQAVSYGEQAGSGFSALDLLRGRSDGHMDEVHAIRDRTGADLVHLIHDVTDVGGVADPPRGLSEGAFGVTCAHCDGLVFAHELGHNMGLSHDRYVDVGYVGFLSAYRSGGGLLPYSYGYVNQQAFAAGAPESARWRTIMAYGHQCGAAGFGCDRIMRFSNPSQNWLGDPLGVPGNQRTGEVAGPANAVRTLNLTRHSVAALRPPSPQSSTPPTSTLSQARPATGTGRDPAPLPGGGLFGAMAAEARRAALAPSDPVPLRRRQVSVDVGRLARIQEGGRTALRLNLFDDVVLAGIIQRRAPTYSGGHALSGLLAGVPGGSVTLVVNGSLVAGTVRLPGAVYRILPTGGDSHTIIQLDPSQLSWRCGTEP